MNSFDIGVADNLNIFMRRLKLAMLSVNRVAAPRISAIGLS
jgi:hypothetical protein